jgi:hypothetical protein
MTVKFVPMLLLCLLGAAQAHADPRSDVQQAFEQVIAADGFRAYAQGHVFGPDLPSMSGDVDVVFPDRIHARTDEMEFIALPNGAWIKALGLWTATDRSLLPVTGFDPKAMRQALASIHDVHIESGSKTSQCAAHVYRFHASGKLPGASTDGDVRAWLCDGSNRIARIEATDARTRDRVILDFDWSRRPSVQAPAD